MGSLRYLDEAQGEEGDKETVGSIAEHYERHNDNGSYEKAWFYSDPTYQDFLINSLRTELFGLEGQPRAEDIVVDIGCGTGKFSRLLGAGVGLQNPVYGVDPFLLKEQAPDGTFIALPPMGALEFAGRVEELAAACVGPSVVLNKILMKEVVHHLNDEFAEICRCISEYFRKHALSACTLVVATRLADPGAYPFFAAASEAWRRGQEDAQFYAQQMEDAGLANVRTVVKSFRVEMEVEQWKSMVRSRFWSNFGELSDEQIEQGLEEMGGFEEFLSESDPSRLVFYDKFVFISGQVGH